MKSQKGQGAIELIIYTTLMLALVFTLFSMFYISFTRVLVTYELQRTGLCLEKYKSQKARCVQSSQKTLSKHLWFHSQKKLSASKSSGQITVSFNGRFADRKSHFKKTIEINR